MSKTKLAITHLKLFKKLVKSLCTNLVDSYPAKKPLMQMLVKEILNFSKSKMRLLRYAFTMIGLTLFSSLIAETHSLQTLKGFFANQEDR